MLVGVCQVELFVPDSGSLKSRRLVLSSLKSKIRNKFNVSVSEVGETDKWQRITLGIAVVASERKFIDETITQVINFIDGDGRAEILDHSLEVL